LETFLEKVLEAQEVKSGTKYHIGTWEPDAKGNSSKWREFKNIVEALKKDAACGISPELWCTCLQTILLVWLLCTRAVLPVPSSCLTWFALEKNWDGSGCKVLCLALLQWAHEGKRGRLCTAGTLKEGVTAGMDMLGFILLDETCFDQEPKLKEGVKTWAENQGLWKEEAYLC
jgi:hypothetical protein